MGDLLSILTHRPQIPLLCLYFRIGSLGMSVHLLMGSPISDWPCDFQGLFITFARDFLTI